MVGKHSTAANFGVGANTTGDSAAAIATELKRRHTGARVLLAEDNEVNLEIATAILTGVGLEVHAADNGQEAVNMAKAERYDLVLMDLQMPRLNGIAATIEIRAIPGWASIPILAMTANAFDEDRRACEAAGMNALIVKPVDMEEMYSTILKWLDWAADSRV